MNEFDHSWLEQGVCFLPWVGTRYKQGFNGRTDFVAACRPFRAVIDALRPERIIVCGKRLWRGMEAADSCLHDDIQGYRLCDGEAAWCLARVHPSSGRYSWRRLHPLIGAFISDPKKAGELLRAQ